MENVNQSLEKILAKVQVVQTQLDALNSLVLATPNSNSIAPEWVPKRDLMKFLGYGDTKIAELLNSDELVVCTIGKRKFIHKESLSQFLTKNVK
jgi:hypothetical protein